ncbi:MAG: 30S ribosomal protein S20 [Proteobacteria bacterium]|nr:30S ribosomal protein S20 [Pseudomonadota bacterium]
MPNHKSAEKRDRQRKKRRLANRAVVGRMRTVIKLARAAVDQKNPEADKLIKQAVSYIDQAVSKGALKRNTGSRYISRLVRRTVPD